MYQRTAAHAHRCARGRSGLRTSCRERPTCRPRWPDVPRCGHPAARAGSCRCRWTTGRPRPIRPRAGHTNVLKWLSKRRCRATVGCWTQVWPRGLVVGAGGRPRWAGV